MELASTFDDVVRIAQTAVEPASGWSSMVDYLEQQTRDALPRLRSVDLNHDVADVRMQLLGLVASEPPPLGLNAIYFGLFDAVDEDHVERIGYYVAGVMGFDPADGDSLCRPAWWPEGRYLSSEALDAVKEVELASLADAQAEKRQLLGYAGQLGAALLVSRFASTGLFPDLRRVVGFDSGDFTEFTT